MKLYDLLNGKDKLKIVGMWFATVLCGLILFVRNAAGLDYFLITVCISALFFAVFLLMLTNDYVLEERELQVHQTIQRAFWTYCGCAFVCVLGSLLPVPVHFMLGVATLLCVLLPERYGLFLALLISIVIGLNGLGSYFDLIYLIYLCLVGGLFSGIISKRKVRLQSSIMVLALYISVFFIGSYMSTKSLSYVTLAEGCGEGILNVLLILGITSFFEKKEQQEKITEYGIALEEDFPLMVFLKSLPEERYKHSRFVANCCYKCAKEAGLDEKLCCCAGFYYSLCDNDEKDPVSYAVKLAKQNRLPITVVRILNQYHGSKQAILSKEAALVDLVDETVCTLEKSELQRMDGIGVEMLILKSFNDLSETGRYDESGLGMNTFLRIRDCLLHEVEVNDSECYQ